MSSDGYRGDLARLQRDAATLHGDLAKQEEIAAKARAEAARKRKSASQTKSASTAQSYLRSAEGEEKKVAGAERKIGEIRLKLAANADRQREKERNLASALKSERTAADRAEDQRKRKEKSEQSARDREAGRRRQKERDHAREIARLSSPTVQHVFMREPEPERLRVLYLTSSPDPTSPLRVDAEVNNVLKELRGAKYRELIEVHHRPAAGPEDLINGINDHRPHVIHFSGHGGYGGLSFDDANMDVPEEQLVDYEILAKLLRATAQPPKLVVLNACHSLAGSDYLLASVPVLVAMSAAVGDLAAGLFATRFYAAIAAAQSVGHAVEQARAVVSMALPDEPDVVTLCARPGVDVNELQLVKPS